MSYFETTTLNDAILLANVASISSTGNTPSVDSTGFGSLVIQIFGSGTIEAIVQGSNDGINYDNIFVKSFDEVKIKDVITQLSSYFFDTAWRYYNLNIISYTGTVGYTILGRAMSSPTIVDNITNALEPDTPLNINLVSGINRDSLNSIILSDGIVYNITNLQKNQSQIFNCVGYSSVIFNLNNNFQPQFSNDGIVWNLAAGINIGGTGGLVNSVVFSGLYIFPIFGKYLKITSSIGNLTGTLMLKYAACNFIHNNMMTIQGTSVVTGGVAGLLGVGGNIAAGVAPTANPVPIGSIDTSGLTRMVLSDPTGKLITQESSLFEGQNQVELLGQILLELRILNQQIYNIQLNDIIPPDTLRTEQSIFNQ